jgi:MFS family permease
MKALHTSPFNLAVIVSGLGFFVDAFDLFLFSVYRIPSLKDMGLSGTDLTRHGELLLSWQMAGMMLGGILSGIAGDKLGRVSVLYASITLYSLANIANSYVADTASYAVVRFLAGIGLAGELGAGITLVSESMTIEKRGYGTILVATLGALGAVSAGLISDFIPWRTAFFAAGVAGLALLLLRMKSMESSMFHSLQNKATRRGSFLLLASNPRRAFRYLACILMGVPIWYSVGLLITLAPDLAHLRNISGLKLSTSFILFQVGICLGDLSSGILSQWFKSRKKILIAYMLLAMLSTVWYFHGAQSVQDLYLGSLFIGLGCGYLSVFVTSSAERFGTNLRVLVTSTVTNFMRGAVVILVPFHIWLESAFTIDLVSSLAITGTIVWALALLSTIMLEDTYGKDLEFVDS